MKSLEKNKQINRESRRTFLQKSFMVGAGVASAVAIPSQVLAASEETPLLKPEQSATPVNKEEGYRVTQHIADYYKSAQL